MTIPGTAARLPAGEQRISEPTGAAVLESAVASPLHGWLWWFCYSLAWVGTLTLVVAATLRVFYHDGTYFLTWINAFTRYVYLPAYACVAWAVWQRRWGLALVGFATVVCHLVWIAPDFRRDRRFDAPAPASTTLAAESPSLRIFFANVLQTNRQSEALFQEISAAEPDVVAFAEWGSWWNARFKESRVGAAFVHGLSVRQPQTGSVNVFSKQPLSGETRNWVAGRLIRSASIQLGSQSLRVIALHAPRPLHAPNYNYGTYWDQMLDLLATESGPLVVIGDFNATEHSLVYKRLQELGLRSAHDDRGRGYATTWPNDEYTWFPPIRIDQVFLSPGVACDRIVEGRGQGSDHTPLVVDVRIRDTAPPALRSLSGTP